MESEKQTAVLDFYQTGFTALKKFCGVFCIQEPWLAEDFAQEAFIKAYFRADQLEDVEKLKTWVYTIAKNECIMHYRPLKNAPGVDMNPFRDESDDDRNSLMPVDNKPGPDQKILIKETLGQMAKGYREILLLHDYEGYFHDEAGQILGTAEGTCKSQLFKARAQARRIIETGSKKEKKTTCDMTFLQGSKK